TLSSLSQSAQPLAPSSCNGASAPLPKRRLRHPWLPFLATCCHFPKYQGFYKPPPSSASYQLYHGQPESVWLSEQYTQLVLLAPRRAFLTAPPPALPWPCLPPPPSPSAHCG